MKIRMKSARYSPIYGNSCTSNRLPLPDGKVLHLSISGGIAWYPEDGTQLDTLKKYADFAMYQIKHSRKGALGEFDLGSYNQEAYFVQARLDLHRLIENEMLSYHFQPIVSARTGQIVAYEALMRSMLPTLKSPDTIMKLAREETVCMTLSGSLC